MSGNQRGGYMEGGNPEMLGLVSALSALAKFVVRTQRGQSECGDRLK